MTATFKVTGDLNDLLGSAPAKMSAFVASSVPAIISSSTGKPVFTKNATFRVTDGIVNIDLPAWDSTNLPYNSLTAQFGYTLFIGTQKWVFTARAVGATLDLSTITNTLPGPLTPSLVDQASALLAQTQTAAAAAQAVGTTNDTVIAGQVNSATSATRTALDGRYGQAKVTARALNLEQANGVDPSGALECGDAILTAIADAARAGVPIRAVEGTSYKSAKPLVLNNDCDLSSTYITYTGTTGIAVTAGNTSGGIVRKTMKLPSVIAGAKTGSGWGQVAGTVGVRILNAQACDIWTRDVVNFETGLQLYGQGQGTAYNRVYPGQLSNNKRNLVFDATSNGWANQNQIIGGRLSHDGAEGTAVAGTRQVLMANSTPYVADGNVFLGTSLENVGVAEYLIECFGNYNAWNACRWENYGAAGTKKIWFRGTAQRNRIFGGYQEELLTKVDDSGTHHNRIGLGPRVCTTAFRPAANDVDTGEEVWDSSIAKPIYWSGTGWRDATGAAV